MRFMPDTPEVNREQFAQHVIDLIRSRFPLVKIARAQQPFAIRMNGRVATLENLYRGYMLTPDELQRQVERWAVELLRDAEGSPDRLADLDAVRDRLLPLLVSADLATLQQSQIVMQPLVHGLHVAYVLDGDRTIAYLPLDVLDRWKQSIDELHDTALANLVERSQAMQAHAAQDDAGKVNLVLFQTLDGFDAARMLLPTLHGRLRELLGSPFGAAVPNRDILICFRADDETTDRIRTQVAQDFSTMPHQITDRLFLVTADGIAPMQ